MKVSIFVHNLSGNPIVRVYPIAKAIQHLGHEVEILGLTFNTEDVYEPYRNEFEYKKIKSFYDIRWVLINSRKLRKMATGDVVYAFKPLWDSFFPALLYSRFGFKRRIILDAEDNELWDAFIGNGWKDLWKNKFYPLNPIFNKLLHPFTFFVKRKTVVCRNLQKRYGGTIVLHGPDANRFDPENYPDAVTLKVSYGIPADARLLLFAGKSVHYNGLTSIVETLQSDITKNWHLVLLGNADQPAFKEAKEKLGNRCHLLGFVQNSAMPALINMCDVAPIIQTPIPSTEYQIPAKMLEAMAMKKGIITTDVSDMKTIIGTSNSGWVIPFGDNKKFADILADIETSPEELKTKGENARNYFLQNASIEIIAERIKPFFDNVQLRQKK